MTWRPSKSPRECSGINRRDTVSCFVIHKYGDGKQRLLVAADPCASSQVTQSQRVHTKERRTPKSALPVDPVISVAAFPPRCPLRPTRLLEQGGWTLLAISAEACRHLRRFRHRCRPPSLPEPMRLRRAEPGLASAVRLRVLAIQSQAVRAGLRPPRFGARLHAGPAAG